MSIMVRGHRGSTLCPDASGTATLLLRATMAGRGDPGEYVLAMHDFVPVNGNTTCLSFRAGQVIHVLNRDDTGWWDGELEGRRGWFPSNYVKANKRRQRNESVSSESGSEAEPCPRVMVSLYHALLVLNTSVHASRVSHYQPSTACVISSVRTVLTATDCLHKTAPALARFPHLARARSDVLQELGRLVGISKKASAPDVPDAERTWLAEEMLRYGDAVFACCKRYVEVAVSCGVHVAGRSTQPHHHPNELAPRLTSASVSSFSSVSSSTSPGSPTTIPSGHVPSAQLLSALRTTHDHLLSIIAAFIGHVHSHSRASHASSKGHLIKMTRETVDKVRQVLTIVCAVCDHPAVVGPERVALTAAKDALHSATSVLVEAVKRLLAPGNITREEEEKAVAVQAATGTLRAGGDCVTAVRSCLTRRSGYEPADMLVFDVPAPPPSVSDQTRSTSSASPSGSEAEAGPSSLHHNGTLRGLRARQRASVLTAARGWQADPGPSHARRRSNTSPGRRASGERRMSEEAGRASQEEWRRYRRHMEATSSGEEEPRRVEAESRRVEVEPRRSVESGRRRRGYTQPLEEEHERQADEYEEQRMYDGQQAYDPHVRAYQERQRLQQLHHPVDETEVGNESITVRPELGHEPESIRVGVELEEVKEVQVGEEELTPGPVELPLEDVMPPILENVETEAPQPEVVVSSTTSRAGSFDAGDAKSSFEQRSSQFGVPSLFEYPRSSQDTAATTVVPDEQEQPYDEVEVDAESLMVGPPTGLPGLADEQGFDTGFEDPERTPIPPQFQPEEQPEFRTSDLQPSVRAADKSLPDIPPPIPIAQGVDLLAIQTIDPRDVAYNNDGQLIGATLDVLVEKMTAPDRTPDPKFAATFYLSFRLFTTPLELVRVLHQRWDMRPPLESYTKEEFETWCRLRLNPVRLRVYNFIKTWLDAHWQASTDAVALGPLQDFVSATAASMPAAVVQRVVDLLTQREPGSIVSDARLVATSRPMDRARSSERTRTKHANGSAPTPILSKSLFALLKTGAYASVNVVDFDALELARQFTIMELHLYCRILPEEILDVGLPSSAGERGNSIRAMSTLSTAITGWVTETILDEQDTKKRTALLKLFIKIADHCDDLNNFSTLRSILAALDSSTISRLSKTWIGLSAKNKARLENLRKLTDHTRNHHEYRTRLRSVRGHAVPFLGLYLTDVTFCREGNPDKRVAPYDNSRTLLNFDKYRRLAAIAEDVQRFQVPYPLIEVPEVQKYLDYQFEKVKKSGNDLHDLYRRSLLVEPRQPADTLEQKAGTMKSSELFGWASRDKS